MERKFIYIIRLDQKKKKKDRKKKSQSINRRYDKGIYLIDEIQEVLTNKLTL